MSRISNKADNNSTVPKVWAGVDRRSGAERRRGDRRKLNLPVSVDRRRGEDRRRPVDRRVCPLS